MINEALKTKTDTDPPKHIIIKDCLQVDGPSTMAEAFNDFFFVNLGPNLTNKVIDSQTEFHAFLKSRNSPSKDENCKSYPNF